MVMYIKVNQVTCYNNGTLFSQKTLNHNHLLDKPNCCFSNKATNYEEISRRNFTMGTNLHHITKDKYGGRQLKFIFSRRWTLYLLATGHSKWKYYQCRYIWNRTYVSPSHTFFLSYIFLWEAIFMTPFKSSIHSYDSSSWSSAYV